MITGGRNQIDNTKVLMKLRSVYEKEGYPIVDAISLPYSLNMDFYKLKPFYGRIDFNSNCVTNCKIQNGLVSETANIKSFPQSSQKAMDFVVDAFLDMQRFYRNGIFTLAGLSREGPLADINVVSSWVSPFNEYNVHIENISNRFLSSFYFKEKQNSIITFDQFIKVFYVFIDDEIKNFPITYSNYSISRFCNPKISGLMLDLAKDDFGNDYIKTNNYIETRNFTWFQECTSRFGFYVDQYAPWRIVANISSKIMQDYMSKYSINESKDLFDKKFVLSYTFDIDLLYKLLVNMFNKLAETKPVAIQVKRPDCVEKINRKQISVAEAKVLFPIQKMLKFYTFLRARELAINIGDNKITQAQFNNILLNAQTILSAKNTSDSLKYVNEKFNGLKAQIVKREFLTEKTNNVILEPNNLIQVSTEEKIKISL